MSAAQNIFAYTDTSTPYPGFVSLNLQNSGELLLTVREPVNGTPLVNIPFPDAEVEKLITGCGMYMSAKLPHRSEVQRQSTIDNEVLHRVAGNVGIAHEMGILASTMKHDPDYLWSWHCNLVVSFVDAGCDKRVAMNGSARFIQTLTGVDVTEHPQFKAELDALPE